MLRVSQSFRSSSKPLPMFECAFALQAYRDLARITHPDKVSGAEAKVEAEKKFMEVAEAYEVRPSLLTALEGHAWLPVRRFYQRYS